MAVTEKLSTVAFITKVEAREYLLTENAEQDRSDSELNTLYRLLDMVCQGCETFIGRHVIIRTGLVQYDDGGASEVFLRQRPVTAVSAVVESGVTLTALTDYDVELESGIIVRLTGSFLAGIRTVKVTYNAGYGTQTRDGSQELASVTGVPYDIKLAASIWLLQAWRHGPENYSPQQSETVGRWGTAIPNESKDILRPYCLGPIGA
jgi:hypothetical protein